MIIADSSALVALSSCQSLWVLNKLFDEIKVPTAVFNEIIIPGKPQAHALRIYLEDKIVSVDLKAYEIKKKAGLGRGELEAIALYMHLSADLLLVDDAKARKAAQFNKIDVIGSLGILLLAKQHNLLDEIKPLIKLLRSSGIYISESLINHVLVLAGED